MTDTTETNIIGIPLGKRIAAARKKANISQLELSIRTGITRDQISRIELCKCTPRLETIELIEKILGLPEWSLLTGGHRSITIHDAYDCERERLYRQIINELENRELTLPQLRVVGNAAISFADSLKN